MTADETHQWHFWHDIECCKICMMCRRADRKNKPCSGVTPKLGLREKGGPQ